MNEVARKDDRTYVWLAISAVLVALFSQGARVAGDESSRQVGQVIGAIIGTFFIAALVWTILWLIVGRRKGRRWLSPWIGWLAVTVALLIAVTRNADTA